MKTKFAQGLAAVFTLLLSLAGDAVGDPIKNCVFPDGHIESTDKPCPVLIHLFSTPGNRSDNDHSHYTVRAQAEPKTNPQPGIPVQNNGKAHDELPANERLNSCDPAIANAAANEIISDPASMREPLQLFSPAFVIFQNGKKDEGVFWFYAAQLRLRQQLVVENGDRGQLLAAMRMTMGPLINNYAFQNIANFDRILDKVLKWDKETTNPFLEKARLKNLEKQIDQVYTGFNEFKTKLATENTSMEAAARQAAPGVEQTYAQMNAMRCRPGQPDPAYENRTKKEEQQLAMDFVTHNSQIIKLAGGPVKTSPGISTTYIDRNKGRYDLSISGPKSFYAVVDVNRQTGKPEFSLACVTTLSFASRQVGKDACSQSAIPLPE